MSNSQTSKDFKITIIICSLIAIGISLIYSYLYAVKPYWINDTTFIDDLVIPFIVFLATVMIFLKTISASKYSESKKIFTGIFLAVIFYFIAESTYSMQDFWNTFILHAGYGNVPYPFLFG